MCTKYFTGNNDNCFVLYLLCCEVWCSVTCYLVCETSVVMGEGYFLWRDLIPDVLAGPASIGLLSPGILEYLLHSLVSVFDPFVCIHTWQMEWNFIISIIVKSWSHVC